MVIYTYKDYLLSMYLYSFDLNDDSEWQARISFGKLFQKVGPRTFNALAPASVDVLGTKREF